MNEQDKLHLFELLSYFYPKNKPDLISSNLNEVIPPSTLKTETSSQTISEDSNSSPNFFKKAELSPYYKKIQSWFSINKLIVYESCEAKTVTIPTLKAECLPCLNYESLGNSEIPLFERARFFLNQIQYIPSKVNYFRPFPNLTPTQIDNPQSAAVAMAYDFLDVILKNCEEYSIFLSQLLKRDYEKDSRSHFLYWPYWAHYYYPSIPCCYILQKKDQKKSTTEKKDKDSGFYEFWPIGTNNASAKTSIDPSPPKSPILVEKKTERKLRPRETEVSKRSRPKSFDIIKKPEAPIQKVKCVKGLYYCPNPGCEKVYKNTNGMKYHLAGGRCESVAEN